MKKKITIIIFALVIVSVIILFALLTINRVKQTNDNQASNVEVKKENVDINKVEEEDNVDDKVDIIDVNSKTRPYAISINNTPVAVKVQTGLNKAYLVYEIPTEGNTSRLMALYKDIKEDLNIGTIRSSRHNFIDYALESNAIFVHYGWSKHAEKEEKAGAIDYINGLFDNPFWRDNPENLAVEHTAYTSIEKIKQTVKNKGFKTESENTVLLKYNVGDIDLSNKSGARISNKVVIPYGANPNVTTFEYDKKLKMYYRLENGEYCVDYYTKEKVDTKNIIVQKIDYSMCQDNYYWDLKTIGSGEGYFITNGYAIPIKWKKDRRSDKTKYYYKDTGEEIEVSDGRTYIEIQTNKNDLTIE